MTTAVLDPPFPIPAAARTFARFRQWIHSAGLPETLRADFLEGEVATDMSPEDLYTHGAVKTCIASTLHTLVRQQDLGEVFIDRTRLTHPQVELSVEPDVVLVLFESLEAGRVRPIPARDKGPGRFVELEGAADLVVEIVSDSSVDKDTRRLPKLYAQAGVRELWLVDARGPQLKFQVRALTESGASYQTQRATPTHWVRSPLLDVSFRLRREATRFGTWAYDLDVR